MEYDPSPLLSALCGLAETLAGLPLAALGDHPPSQGTAGGWSYVFRESSRREHSRTQNRQTTQGLPPADGLVQE